MVSALIIVLSSCSKDPDIDGDRALGCVDLAEKISESLTTYVNDPTVANCQAYVKNLKKYLNGKACFGHFYYEAYREALDELEDECTD